MEQQDLNKRLLLALVLSVLVFVGYSYIFAPTPSEKDKTEQNLTMQNSSTAPVASVSKSNNIQSTTLISPQSVIAEINSKNFKATIDNYGRISQFYLLEDKYKTEDGKNLALFDNKKVKPLEIRFSDVEINDEAFKTPYTADVKSINITEKEETIKLTQKLTSLTITKSITFKPSGEYYVVISTSKPVQFFITPGNRPTADTAQYMVVKGALALQADNTIKIFEDGDVSSNEEIKNASILSAFDRYYASLFFNKKNALNGIIAKDDDENPLIFVSSMGNLALSGYIGPKDYNTLNSIDPKLTNAIEYGWFTWLSKPFFFVIKNIHEYVGNWGWAIVIFTIFIKVLLFWPTYRGMLSMQKLKDLAPKMKDIKEKYASDPAKMNMHMMELYKKHGANPFGGCLPILLQIPIFFALYRVLLNADELQGAPWILWIDDLAKMDPFYILPLLMGVAMWYQQKITPSNFTDPLQEKIFKFFPVLMTIFFISFPAGLVLYWLTNNILSIGQQMFVNRAYAKHKLQEIEAHHKKSK